MTCKNQELHNESFFLRQRTTTHASEQPDETVWHIVFIDDGREAVEVSLKNVFGQRSPAVDVRLLTYNGFDMIAVLNCGCRAISKAYSFAPTGYNDQQARVFEFESFCTG